MDKKDFLLERWVAGTGKVGGGTGLVDFDGGGLSEETLVGQNCERREEGS